MIALKLYPYKIKLAGLSAAIMLTMMLKPNSFFPFSVVMGPDQNFLTQVGSGQFFVARAGSAIYGLG